MNIGDFFNLILIQPILNLLLLFNFISTAVNLPFSFGFAIIFLTLFVRFILAPLTAAQLKNAAKTAKLRPKLAELTKKHGSDKQALARAQMELYKQHGVNPAAGCLPLLLQIPIFIALYQVLFRVLGNDGGLTEYVNQLTYFPLLEVGQDLNLNFFGFNLAARPADFSQAGVHLLLIPPVTAVLQWWQSKIMMFASSGTSAKTAPKKSTNEKPTTEETLSQIQSQMVYLMPIMIGFFSFGFPVGLSLYWNVFTVFGVVQQYWINKELSLGKILKFRA